MLKNVYNSGSFYRIAKRHGGKVKKILIPTNHPLIFMIIIICHIGKKLKTINTMLREYY